MQWNKKLVQAMDGPPSINLNWIRNKYSLNEPKPLKNCFSLQNSINSNNSTIYKKVEQPGAKIIDFDSKNMNLDSK